MNTNTTTSPFASFPKLLILLLLPALLFVGSCKQQKKDGGTRYLVLSPEVAEIMAGLGLTPQIVGLTEECTYPAEFASIPKVGKFGLIRKESVFQLEPDIIFTSGLEQDALSAELRKLDYEVISIHPRSLEDMYAGIINIGEVTNTTKRAEQMVAELKAAVAKTQGKAKDMMKPRVYIEINRDPLMSASSDSFVGQVIKAAGGENIFATLERDYARVKPEDVILGAPDIIICYSQDSITNIVNRKGWQNIPAIKNGMIYQESGIDPDLIQRAGPRVVKGIERLYSLFKAWEQNQGE